jgi:hypothetical protein
MLLVRSRGFLAAISGDVRALFKRTQDDNLGDNINADNTREMDTPCFPESNALPYDRE